MKSKKKQKFSVITYLLYFFCATIFASVFLGAIAGFLVMAIGILSFFFSLELSKRRRASLLNVLGKSIPLIVVLIWVFTEVPWLHQHGVLLLFFYTVFTVLQILLAWSSKQELLSIFVKRQSQNLIPIDLKEEKDIEHNWFDNRAKEIDGLGFVHLSDFKLENSVQFYRVFSHPHNHSYLELCQSKSQKGQKFDKVITLQSRFSDGWGLSHYLSQPGKHQFRIMLDSVPRDSLLSKPTFSGRAIGIPLILQRGCFEKLEFCSGCLPH